ncbi:membrane protein insertion efficiency factor YidD [Nautilia sp. PV-1]|nr:membrane protein insertion efficiency factor YidD [Nautilia sp. PV-1]
MKNFMKSLKNLPLKLISFYQLFISPLLGNNCRYYPSCSEYAKIELENDTFLRAVFKSTVRFLTCNQLFKGGIDFPVVKRKIKTTFFIKKPKLKYWLVPTNKKDQYIVIKVEYGE